MSKQQPIDFTKFENLEPPIAEIFYDEMKKVDKLMDILNDFVELKRFYCENLQVEEEAVVDSKERLLFLNKLYTTVEKNQPSRDEELLNIVLTEAERLREQVKDEFEYST